MYILSSCTKALTFVTMT